MKLIVIDEYTVIVHANMLFTKFTNKNLFEIICSGMKLPGNGGEDKQNFYENVAWNMKMNKRKKNFKYFL